MKAQIISYPPPPQEVVVTMTMEEARALSYATEYAKEDLIVDLIVALQRAGVVV